MSVIIHDVVLGGRLLVCLALLPMQELEPGASQKAVALVQEMELLNEARHASKLYLSAFGSCRSERVTTTTTSLGSWSYYLKL